MEMNEEAIIGAAENLIPKFSRNAILTMPSAEKSNPLTIEPIGSVNCLEWAEAYKTDINGFLLAHGAVLLRGFTINSADIFSRMFSIIAGNPLEYKNRTSPRDLVFKNVYTSTNHPNDQVIHMHTENSYSKTATRIISFFCLIPPAENGETPIADERELVKYLGTDIVNKFREKNILYIRNVMPGIGLDLKTIYQTADKTELNKMFKDMGVDYNWVTEDHIRLKWVLPAFVDHPLTRESLWFNHMYFGHKSMYSPEVLDVFEDEDLPFATYYGDGTPIEENVIEKFRRFYARNSIIFKWRKSDMLLLDNMMFSHGRRPYSGERVILTAMGQPVYVSKPFQ